MRSISVVFAVGNDIVEKLESVASEKRKDFILGITDNDYFGDHFLSIEELDPMWKAFFDEVGRRKNLKILEKGRQIDYQGRGRIIVVEERKHIEEIYQAMERWKPEEISRDYRSFLEEIETGEEEFSFYRYVNNIERIKDICEEARKKDGNLLLCLEI